MDEQGAAATVVTGSDANMERGTHGSDHPVS